MPRFDTAKLHSKYAQTKVASVYDRFATFNRSLGNELTIDGFSDFDRDQLHHYVQKTAAVIDMTPDPSIQKQAFLTGGADLFAKAKAMVMSQLGYDEARAAQMASSVVKTAGKIMEMYGGDEHQIIHRLVEEIKNQTLQNGGNSSDVADAHEILAMPRTSKQIHEFTKQQLVKSLRVNHYEAERLAKSTVQAARDLLIRLRPHTLAEIVNTIILLMQHYNDPTIVYGLPSDPYLMEELSQALQQVGGR